MKETRFFWARVGLNGSWAVGGRLFATKAEAEAEGGPGVQLFEATIRDSVITRIKVPKDKKPKDKKPKDKKPKDKKPKDKKKKS